MIKDVVDLSTQNVKSFDEAVKHFEFKYRNNGKFVIPRDTWDHSFACVMRLAINYDITFYKMIQNDVTFLLDLIAEIVFPE